MRYILATGDRYWTNYLVPLKVLSSIPDPCNVTLVHGSCKGADTLVDYAASLCNIPRIPVPAEWGTINNKAEGMIRNKKMLDDYPIERVYAFHSNIFNSKGTKGMIRLALERDIPVILLDGKKIWQIEKNTFLNLQTLGKEIQESQLHL